MGRLTCPEGHAWNVPASFLPSLLQAMSYRSTDLPAHVHQTNIGTTTKTYLGKPRQNRRKGGKLMRVFWKTFGSLVVVLLVGQTAAFAQKAPPTPAQPPSVPAAAPPPQRIVIV